MPPPPLCPVRPVSEHANQTYSPPEEKEQKSAAHFSRFLPVICARLGRSPSVPSTISCVAEISSFQSKTKWHLLMTRQPESFHPFPSLMVSHCLQSLMATCLLVYIPAWNFPCNPISDFPHNWLHLLALPYSLPFLPAVVNPDWRGLERTIPTLSCGRCSLENCLPGASRGKITPTFLAPSRLGD